jgi:hypothetical protein
MPDEHALLAELVRHSEEQKRNSGNPRFRELTAAQVKDGLIVLGDPANGAAFSYQPASEFVRRWHHANDKGEPEFIHTGLVATVPVEKLKEMQREARRNGEPMFSTDTFPSMMNET